jgi:hypothetical protein
MAAPRELCKTKISPVWEIFYLATVAQVQVFALFAVFMVVVAVQLCSWNSFTLSLACHIIYNLRNYLSALAAFLAASF